MGSEDLSSNEETETETESEEDEDEFSSASATECEFTDSEGRPNPFHKELEEGRVVGPESPGASRRIYAQHLIPAPADPSQQNQQAPEYEPTLTYSNKYQYKTPNLSDRLRTEQQSSTVKVQDFSTRRALNLKKNWVSEASTDLSAKKKASDDKAQSNDRLKSLMDRLSNQQKLLKPAEKPSTEMQHFLKASQKPAEGSGGQPKISPSLANGPTSPGIVSPPGMSGSSFSSLYPAPPVYRSVGITSPPSESGDSKPSPERGETRESSARPSLPPVGEEKKSSDEQAGKKRDVIGVRDGDGDKAAKVCDEKKNLAAPSLLAAPLALNESTSSAKDDDFQSCEEGEDGVAGGEVLDAVNPSMSAVTSPPTAAEDLKEEFLTPGTADDSSKVVGEEKEEEGEKPPMEPTSLPPLEDCTEEEEECENRGRDPLATSSPVDINNIALIDDGEEEAKDESKNPPPTAAEQEVQEVEEEEEPRAPVFTEDDVTKIYRERDPNERIAKMNTYKQKEKSVVHDLILNSKSRQRSSSAARRLMRTMPTSGAPPPPPDEAPAETPKVPRPPVRDLAKRPVGSSSKIAAAAATPANRQPPPSLTVYRGSMTAPARGQISSKPMNSAPAAAKDNSATPSRSSRFERANFPLIDEEKSSSAKSTPVKRQISQPATSVAAPPARVERGDMIKPLGTQTAAAKGAPSSQSNDELVSPTTSLHSNCDMDSYMDGIDSTDESLSKSASSAKSPANNGNKTSSSSSSNNKDKRNFMKTISGIFSRSSSLSSVTRNPRGGSLSVFDPDAATPSSSSHQQLNASGASSSAQQPDTASNINNNNRHQPKELRAQQQQQSGNFRFPRLNFARSASAHRDPVKKGAASVTTPDSPPSGEAPRADISELGSLGSLSSSTPKKEPPSGAGGASFKPPFNLKASHPSTPPVPLSRKIAIGLEQSASASSVISNASSSANAASENEENESPEDASSICSTDLRRREEQLRRGGDDRKVPPEILEKILRRGGTKAARRQARVAQVKRARRAQEIQRQLEETEVQHRDLEERGIKAEQSLRGEGEDDVDSAKAKRHSSGSQQHDPELLQSWVQLLSEKNQLVRREQELLVQAKHLELEDRSAKLEAELREHLMLDSRSPEVVAREGEVLGELLLISEQREKLQAMLERDKRRYQREDKDMEAQMAARGIRVSVCSVASAPGAVASSSAASESASAGLVAPMADAEG